MKCLQDLPGIPLYTITNHIQKVPGGIKLPVYRCARGTTSLESFHLHINRFIPGTSANAVNFQAYLLEGISRWNSSRTSDSQKSKDAVISFNPQLKHFINTIGKKLFESDPNFQDVQLPAEFTGKVIGMEFFYRQNEGINCCDKAVLDKTLKTDVKK